jgi:hypothetical protein
MLGHAARDLKLPALLIAGLVALGVPAIDAISNLVELQHLAQQQVRAARYNALSCDFDVNLVRAAGEAASFAVTRNPAYLAEAKEAFDRGQGALAQVRRTLHPAVREGNVSGKLAAILEHQHELLAGVQRATLAAEKLERDGGSVQKVLDAVYAYEPAAQALRQEVARLRESSYADNEAAMQRSLRRTIVDVILCIALLAAALAALAVFKYRRTNT